MVPDEVDEVCVVRPALTVEQRCQKYQYTPTTPIGIGDALSLKVRQLCACSGSRLWAWLQARLPILSWLPNYPIRSALLGDVIAGSTVAIMHIPQGMAYALLANLPPITGLYMAFFPVLIYVLLGTSRHVSMGTFAVACLMMGKVVNELSTEPTDGVAGSGNSTYTEGSDSDVTYTGQQVAAVLALMVGIWEILLGLLQLGAVLNVFLSDMLISGFTTGVAFHVLTSQVKYLFGIPVAAYNGPLKIIYTYIEVFQNILSANAVVMLISSLCIVLLMCNNEMKPRVKKYTNLPIPIELLVVVLGTVASYFGQLHEMYNVRVVGDIPTGLPAPSPPPISLLPRVAVDAFIIGVVGYTSTFSIAKIFAKRRGYTVDATQELYAQGLSNVFGSFFSCGPMAASLSRSLIQEAVGGFTLLTAFISCCFILLILLFIGPLFATLPNCVLSSIIVVSLKGLLLQFKDMKALWSVSRADAFIWIATFTASVIIDIDYGLAVGVLASILVLLLRSQKASTASLGQIPNTDLYLDVVKYPQAVIVAGIHIFHFGGPLHFANVTFFREELLSKTGLESILSRNCGKSQPKSTAQNGKNCSAKELKSTFNSIECDNEGMTTDKQEEKKEKNNSVIEVEKKERTMLDNDKASDMDQQERNEMNVKAASTIIPVQEVKWVIVDFGGISFVDTTGSKQLTQLHQELKDAGITLCIAAASDQVVESLDICGSVKVLGREYFFHSIHDAVTIVTRKLRQSQHTELSYPRNSTHL